QAEEWVGESLLAGLLRLKVGSDRVTQEAEFCPPRRLRIERAARLKRHAQRARLAERDRAILFHKTVVERERAAAKTADVEAFSGHSTEIARRSRRQIRIAGRRQLLRRERRG